MTQTKLALAYCLDNASVAESLEQSLAGSTRYALDHFYGKKEAGGPSLNEQIAGYGGKILLLVSDNFLRCGACLYQGLELLEHRPDDVFPILIKGYAAGEGEGESRMVETRIDKVSDIIHYINYWQDRFLERRKNEREASPDGGSASLPMDHLRAISSEIGEYLRLLRKMEPLPLEELQAASFQPLFQFLGEPEAAQTFSQSVPNGPPEELDLASIPGMDLLEEEPTEKAPSGETDQQEEGRTEDPDRLLETVREAYHNGDEADALQRIEAAVQEHETHIPLRYFYAFLLAKDDRRLDEAEQQLETLLELDEDHADARFLWGEVAELRSDFEAARARYEALAQDFPDYPGINYRLGLVLARAFPEAIDRAIDCLQTATEADPDNLDALYHYAATLGETEQNDPKAEELLQQVIEADDQHPFAHYDLALLAHRQGDLEQARAYYLQATAINPDLRTPTNDQAFGVEEEVDEPTTEPMEPTTPHDQAPGTGLDMPTNDSANGDRPESAKAEDPLAALKQNIEQLEEMLNRRQERVQPPQERQEDRIVMITGATSGIGRATAHLFAQQGFRLILTGRRQERLDDLARIFEEKYKAEVRTLCYDVRHVDALRDAFAGQLDFEWRQIDILINNAGKAKGLDPIYNGKLDHWEEMIDTNIKGLLYTTRAVLPSMIKRRTGHIINVASTAGKEVYAKGNVYCATKFAVDALTKAMRIDLVDFNIRVGQVSPGHVEQTEFAAVRFDGDEDQAKKVYDNFVPLNAHDVADAILYIATRPRHVNVQDILLMGTQQAGASKIDREGRTKILSYIRRIKPMVEEF